jgi:DNA invertase Pin-like site-specific DNA recombinase
VVWGGVDMKTEKGVGIYARCSTSDQSIVMQLNDLEQYSKERGFKIYRIYKDKGISGTQESRPALNELMNDARKKRFNIVLCWRFDRFARSTKHLINSLHEFRNLKIDFISYQENVDTSSSLGQAIFVIISAMAELERNIICERIQAGLRGARSKGVKLERPRTNIDTEKVIEYRKQNKPIRQIANELNLSKGVVQRTLEMCL